MLLLALDTSTPVVTVALHDGENVLAESTTFDARRVLRWCGQWRTCG